MRGRDRIRYAVPMPMRSVAPWHTLNGTETSLLALVYDPLAHRQDGRPASPTADLVWSSDGVEVSIRREAIYADGVPVRPADLCMSMVAVLRRCGVGRYRLSLDRDRLRLEGPSRPRLMDALTMPQLVPFRTAAPGMEILGSHPSTAGVYRLHALDDRVVTLRANDRHRPRAPVERIVVGQESDPKRLLQRFLADELDVIPVGGEERDELERLPAGVGDLRCGPANAISTLVIRGNGVLRDPALRRDLARSVPRRSFAAEFLGEEGEMVSAFAAPARDEGVDEVTTEAAAGRFGGVVDLLVPPQERTYRRAVWLGDRLERRIGVGVRVRSLSWDEYWAAYADAGAGDVLWCGIGVQEDRPRDWIGGILSGSPRLDPETTSLRRRAARASEEELLAIEQELLAGGWVIPLYKHRQCYLCRAGLQGLTIEPTDWPLPGVQHAAELVWG